MFQCNSEITIDNSNEVCNPDDNLSSIHDIKREIKSLLKKKFELETKIASTEPQKFGDLFNMLEITSPPSSNVNFREESQRLHLSKELHFYKLCGIYAMSEEGETRVCFRSIHNSKYSLWIKRNEDCIVVTKYFLPPMIPLEELIETYLKNSSSISGFFRKIYHYIIVYENRISQINDLKSSEEIRSIEFFSSHSTHIIKLKVLLNGEFSRAVNIHLKYPADFIFPQTLLLDGGNLTDKGKKNLMKCCQVFKRMPLLEATREVLPYLKSL